MTRIEQNIRDYIFWQKNRLSDIKNINIEERKHHERIFKKTLIFPLIDSMSKIYSHEDGNKKRFIDFVEKCSSWNEKNLISLVHINKFLDIINEPELESIKNICNDKYSQLENGKIYYYEIDLENSEINSFWPIGSKGEFKKYKIPNGSANNNYSFEDFTHISLLYSYRNFCVHELRSAGTDLNISGTGKPNYINFKNNGGNDWALVYPIEFFITLTETLITNFEKYLRLNQLDPYESYNNSRYWIEALEN